jgi:hypothetical protein
MPDADGATGKPMGGVGIPVAGGESRMTLGGGNAIGDDPPLVAALLLRSPEGAWVVNKELALCANSPTPDETWVAIAHCRASCSQRRFWSFGILFIG